MSLNYFPFKKILPNLAKKIQTLHVVVICIGSVFKHLSTFFFLSFIFETCPYAYDDDNVCNKLDYKM